MNKAITLKRRLLVQVLVGVAFYANGIPRSVFASLENKLVLDDTFFKELSINANRLKKFAGTYLAPILANATQNEIEYEIFGAALGKHNQQKMKTYIKRKIANDFNTENTIVVDGWVLSKTEVQIWYIYYLSPVFILPR
jgi:hypothetical protein